MQIKHLEKLRSDSYFKGRSENLPCLVREMRNAPSNNVIAMHDHDFSELVLVASGSLNHVHATGTSRLNAGDFFVIHPGERHGYAELSPGTVVFNLLYHCVNPPTALFNSAFPLMPELFPQRPDCVKSDTLGRVNSRNLVEIVNLLKSLRKECESSHMHRKEICTALFTSILFMLAREANVAREISCPIHKELEYINHNLGKKMTLEDLCAVSGLSVSTLSRRFHEAVGRSPGDYIIAARIAKAKCLLDVAGSTLESVALATGFCNAGHLSRALRNNRR